MLNGDPLRTKWGTARTSNMGYYRITSRKEGNKGKLLHRLIAAEYFGEWINDWDDFFDIHHIDENRLNNCVLNLEPIPSREHIMFHQIGKKRSRESRKKMSESKNTYGYLNVSKQKCKSCKQGFTWRYRYSENGKQKVITGVSLEKLESKVKARGLEWLKFKKGVG